MEKYPFGINHADCEYWKPIARNMETGEPVMGCRITPGGSWSFRCINRFATAPTCFRATPLREQVIHNIQTLQQQSA